MSGPPIIQYYPVTVAVPGPPIIIVKEVTVRGHDRPYYITKLVPGPTRIVVQNVTVAIPGPDQRITGIRRITVARQQVTAIGRHEVTAKPTLPLPPVEGTDGRPIIDYTGPIFVRRQTTFSTQPGMPFTGKHASNLNLKRSFIFFSSTVIQSGQLIRCSVSQFFFRLKWLFNPTTSVQNICSIQWTLLFS